MLKISIPARIFTVEKKRAALKWWRTLSINEQKSFEENYTIISNAANVGEIAFIYETEILKPAPAPKRCKVTLELPKAAAEKILSNPTAFLSYLKENGFEALEVRPSYEPQSDPILAWS